MATKKARAVAPKLVLAAAQAADITALKTLLAADGDLNVSYRQYRPLHALIQTKPHAKATAPSAAQLKCFRWLLAHGADPEQTGAWPETRAILVAAFWGSRDYVDILRDHGVRIDVFVSAALGDAKAVTRALSRDAGVATARDQGGVTVLQCAAASRMWRVDAAIAPRLRAIATAVLDAGAEPHAPTRSWGHDVDAVYFAASSHHVDLFALLLARGADATRALTPALWNGGDAFEALGAAALAHGADVNRAVASGRPLLNDLIRWGQFGPARWLLAHGADPNRAQADGLRDAEGTPSPTGGWTALHHAASRGNAKMVETLLAAGADPSRRDLKGRTPLDIARAAPLKALIKRVGGKARGIMHT